MVKGLHSFSIIVSSNDSVTFYEKLGFKIIFRKDRNYDAVVVMEGFGIRLQLFVDPKHPKRATDPENLGFRGIALRVGNVDEMKRLFDCSEIKTDWFGNRYCITHDPDGLPIQFCEG